MVNYRYRWLSPLPQKLISTSEDGTAAAYSALPPLSSLFTRLWPQQGHPILDCEPPEPCSPVRLLPARGTPFSWLTCGDGAHPTSLRNICHSSGALAERLLLFQWENGTTESIWFASFIFLSEKIRRTDRHVASAVTHVRYRCVHRFHFPAIKVIPSLFTVQLKILSMKDTGASGRFVFSDRKCKCTPAGRHLPPPGENLQWKAPSAFTSTHREFTTTSNPCDSRLWTLVSLSPHTLEFKAFFTA